MTAFDILFRQQQQYEDSKAMTVARTAMRTTAIPVTVGTFEMRRKHEGLKVMKVTRMVNPTGPTPVPREVGGLGGFRV